MDNKFVNCPKCQTRNFSDDKFCGICNQILEGNLKQTVDPKSNKVNKKNSPLTIILISSIIIFLSYVIFFSEDKKAVANAQNLATDIYDESFTKYTILEIALNNKRAFNICVFIKEKIDNDKLISLAQTIKSEVNVKSEKGVVFFLLPGMKVKEGAWAAVDFNPEVNVRIIGKTISDEQKIMSGLESITDYFGLWIDDSKDGDIIFRIRVDKTQGYVYEYISSTNSSHSEFAKPLKRIIKNGRIIFKDLYHTEQYFLIENDGDLSVYDDYGFVVTYKKLK